jgi:hypothetical protein
MRVPVPLFLALLIGWSVSGCDSVPGTEGGSQRPPSVAELSYSPSHVVFDLLPPEQVDADRAKIPLQIEVAVQDVGSGIAEVGFVVQSPIRPGTPLIAGAMTPVGGGRYRATPVLEIPKGEVGEYMVVVFASGRGGQVSNQVRGTLVFAASGRPPVIHAVEAPDVVVRPAAGEPARLVRIVAVVSDPDGLENISRVVMWNVDRPGNLLHLRDDGARTGASGDELAGDGRYTITVTVESTNQPGANTFAFQATDRTGLTSDVIHKTITVE